MNVQEFVRESLVQISMATIEANKAFKDANVGAQANPAGATFESSHSSSPRPVTDTQEITFDIAVTVEASTGSKGGAGLAVAFAGIGGSVASEKGQSTISRIQFVIPLKLPRPAR